MSDYTEDEVRLLCSSSPASQRYLRLNESQNNPRLNAWLESALATFHKTASPEQICLHWSEQTDAIIQNKINEFKFSELGLAVFAMGKLGAKELNLSSDIDLIIMSKTTPSSESIKITRDFVKSISNSVDSGPGYRVDLDLRPGGAGSPIVSPLSLFLDHYWTQSELWERMALVRLRPIGGDLDLIQEVLLARDQFCFRKYLDYSLLEEFKRLRPKIHATSLAGLAPHEINLKLTPGFIRDIELFINAHQIIYGGKDKSLRTSSTKIAAENLRKFEKESGLFDRLLKIYWEYRQWENQVQAVNDFQTHNLVLDRLPKGWEWPDSLGLKERSQFVDEHISELLGSVKDSGGSSAKDLNIDLNILGFSSHSISEVWPEVLRASVLSRQKEIDEAKRRIVISRFVEEISQSAFDKDLGLIGLRDFLVSIRAKATFFHLLAKEHKLIKDLSFLFGLSPYLGSLFSTRPEMIDSFLFNQDDPFSDQLEFALVQMAERKRIAEVKSALSFVNNKNLDSLTETLTATADSICSHLMSLTEKEIGCNSVDLLALGKWGGVELGFKSDLDFVFVCDRPPTEEHHKLVRRFISRLRDPSVGGAIYSIDTRLRPSSQGGALIVQKDQLMDFLNGEASPWERQAYLKARWVTRTVPFHSEIQMSHGLSAEELSQLTEIKAKLLKPLQKGVISLKYSQGAIIDIELALQALILKNAVKINSGSTQHFFQVLNLEGTFLQEHYFELRRLEQFSRILTNEADPTFTSGKKFLDLIGRIVTQDPGALVEHVEAQCAKAREELKKIDPTFS